MAVVTVPTFIQSGGEVAQDARRLLSSVFAHGGVVPKTATFTDLKVSQRAAGANMSVDVAIGDCLVTGTEGASQGLYHAQNVSVTNVAISASDPTNPRYDLIVARVKDATYSGALNSFTIERVGGTPAGAPLDPTIPANCIVLARVYVTALSTSVVNANITDLRTGYAAVTGSTVIGNQVKAAPGGVTVCTSTWRPTVGLYEGQLIFETDTKRLYVYNGAGWDLFDSTPSTWTGPPLLNSWVYGGAPNQAPQYRKVGDMVQLRGFLSSGTFNTSVFVLPTGFRPPADIHVAAGLLSGTGWGRINIVASSGAVIVDNTTTGTPTNGYLSLTGITFSVSA